MRAALISSRITCLIDSTLYTFFVTSKNGDYYIGVHYSSVKDKEGLNFYVSEQFAGELINTQLQGQYKANLLCTLEKLMGEYIDDEYYPCWMCKTIQIERIDKDGNITETYIETGSQPTNPIEEAIQSERAKWDINMDNKIGLEEAIRALQVVSDLRSK